eukprot:TRINITY_DN978_c0_g1_i9.p1 TRINITY_DN978_c0_g1~~TRINITY_DN978_c0_g1_i9.p1  ORF type:complete len:322 (+),score=80.03 TRINITY_DN978_c0_g1_i9:78-1043(+)
MTACLTIGEAVAKWGPKVLKFNLSKKTRWDLPPDLSELEREALEGLAEDARLNLAGTAPAISLIKRQDAGSTSGSEAQERKVVRKVTWEPPGRRLAVRSSNTALTRRRNLLSRLSGRTVEEAEYDVSRMALLAIEFQNEFATEGGKLYPACRGLMEETDMLRKTSELFELARHHGCHLVHCPISFAEDNSDNFQLGFGMLKSCADMDLCKSDSWQAEFCEEMTPRPGDAVVRNKRGLCSFTNTDLEDILAERGCDTLVLTGFLTSCCVESSMRTAYEKGLNVITLTDCTADMDRNAYLAATTVLNRKLTVLRSPTGYLQAI